ncbi:hypothetical protein [uncultured Desulfovibrio sp.]|uniref:Uncharacterized protein n=1 Tax=Candidatus Desulfovibrio intestinavium TaxID=2838534 RepID=A0A9D2KSE0_9BACT|nr:hypothetical protein [uncultured Desulfovibrio sp.]HJA79815.1 hypothetical protein [Candidatus Desulfovibrio intestinavium]
MLNVAAALSPEERQALAARVGPFLPADPVRRFLAARVPWPVRAAAAPQPPVHLPDLPVGSLPALRLAYTLSALPLAEARALARACALACCDLWLADFVPAERNLGLPAACLARLLPGLRPLGRGSVHGRRWLARGGLEGCLHEAGLQALSRRTLLAGAALLVHCRLMDRGA